MLRARGWTGLVRAGGVSSSILFGVANRYGFVHELIVVIGP
jgi:hypothetical protein